MKICVADDEKEVREGIIHKLKVLFPEASLFDVGFGRNALQQITMVKPNLVFLDIRMPEMDGLDILNSLKQKDPDIKAVILSGYDDFEYARKALQFGAIDYMLKPANRDQLREIVDKVMADMESKFKKELEFYLGKLSDQYIFIHDINSYNTDLWFDERQMKQVKIGITASLLEKWEAHPEQILISFSVNQDFGGMIICPTEEHRMEGFHKKSDFLPAMISAIERWESSRFFGGNEEAVTLAKRRRIVNGKHPAKLRQNIFSFAKTMNLPSLEQSLEKWLECLQELEFNELKKECVHLMALLDEGLVSHTEIVVLEEEKIHYWTQWVSKQKTWGELEQSIRKFVLDGIRALKLLENQSSLSWFDHALHIVDTSHNPNLSLETVSEIVGVHSVTLSRIFKQQTGMNFIKYVVRSRLKRAEHLLLKTDKKIDEISEEIGYIDSRYFRNLFKKEFGLTPLEYRKNNGASALQSGT
jgi:two-component system response regulator YesN